ncbi:MAG: hypothetical protein MI924_36645 [Chloroflexales bacterium]|nr:hypothetical protein [Chloroflexales bacterium]
MSVARFPPVALGLQGVRAIRLDACIAWAAMRRYDPAVLACGAVREHPMTAIGGHSRGTQTVAVLNRRFAQPAARPQRSDRALTQKAWAEYRLPVRRYRIAEAVGFSVVCTPCVGDPLKFSRRG